VEKLPYPKNEFDYVVYCYAINNVQATPRVFDESSRVLKQGGKILIADPGISRWVSDLVLHSILDELPGQFSWLRDKLATHSRFHEQIPSYFESKEMSSKSYTDVVLSGLC
jgi:ubiquinone/menaquinone biosynthesis C-methylase UbiE